jgi:dTDP-glucose 4,6-dehydratase
MKRMLITGGAGFIGANFVRYWKNQHPKDMLVVVDAMTYAGNRSNLLGILDDRCELIESNINDTQKMMQLLREYRLETIVHFAAETHVDRSIDGPDVFIEANILGTHSLLKAARQVWQLEGRALGDHRFHHISTDEVYGSLSLTDPAFTEATAYAPNSPYSSSKASSDFLVRAYHHTYGMNTSMTNCSNNYGPFHYPEKLIPRLLLNLLHGRELPVYGNGENIRDWLYVQDHARAIELVLNKGQTGQTYNVGGINEWKNIDIVRLMCQLVEDRFERDKNLHDCYPSCPAACGKPCESAISFVRDRPGHDFRYAIDSSKITKELGYQPETAFESGLGKTVDWYLENSDWWQPLFSG